MNEKFITETHFNKQLCRDFVRYVSIHKQMWLYIVMLALISVIEYKNTHSPERVGLFFAAMVAMFIVSNYISAIILTKRNGAFLKLRFYDHHMFAETETKREKIMYDTISKLVERDKCFYLFFRRGKGAFIIEKSGFSKGNADKFQDFINSCLPKKAK